jgi:hypothetical protein
MNDILLYVSCDKPLDQDYWDAQYKANTTGWDLGLCLHQLKPISYFKE